MRHDAIGVGGQVWAYELLLFSLGVVCDEQNNLHIMKDGYSYSVPKGLYRSYGLFTEKEKEENEDGND